MGFLMFLNIQTHRVFSSLKDGEWQRCNCILEVLQWKNGGGREGADRDEKETKESTVLVKNKLNP